MAEKRTTTKWRDWRDGVLLHIENDGPAIVSTNYWETELSRRGAIYVSINAGAFRILIPAAGPALHQLVGDPEYVIFTRGPMQAGREIKRNALEILFEDGTDSPFVIHIGPEQVDRRIPNADIGRTDLRCLVYVRGDDGPVRVLSLPARYRTAAMLPSLREW